MLKKTTAFSLAELLVVCCIIALAAGVVFPSAVFFIRCNSLEQTVHNISNLCKEAFSQAVFLNKIFVIKHSDSDGELACHSFDGTDYHRVDDYLLKPVKLDESLSLDWPSDGWQVLPQGYCESPLIRISDKNTLETLFYRIRAFDASFIRESSND